MIIHKINIIVALFIFLIGLSCVNINWEIKRLERTLRNNIYEPIVYKPYDGFCGFKKLKKLLHQRIDPDSLETYCGGLPDSSEKSVRQLIRLLGTNLPRHFRKPTKRMILEEWTKDRILSDTNHLSLLDNFIKTVPDNSQEEYVSSLAKIAGYTHDCRFSQSLVGTIERLRLDTSWTSYNTIPHLGNFACEFSYIKLLSYLREEKKCCTYAAILGLRKIKNKCAIPYLIEYLNSTSYIPCFFNSPSPIVFKHDSLWWAASVTIDKISGIDFKGDRDSIEKWMEDSLVCE